jgi:hypothetical protein
MFAADFTPQITQAYTSYRRRNGDYLLEYIVWYSTSSGEGRDDTYKQPLKRYTLA